jgi:hypothetical protein
MVFAFFLPSHRMVMLIGLLESFGCSWTTSGYRDVRSILDCYSILYIHYLCHLIV